MKANRDDVSMVREIDGACRSLSEMSRAWLMFLPKPLAVERARVTVTGLHRLLAELAAYQDAAGLRDDDG